MLFELKSPDAMHRGFFMPGRKESAREHGFSNRSSARDAINFLLSLCVMTRA